MLLHHVLPRMWVWTIQAGPNFGHGVQIHLSSDQMVRCFPFFFRMYNWKNWMLIVRTGLESKRQNIKGIFIQSFYTGVLSAWFLWRCTFRAFLVGTFFPHSGQCNPPVFICLDSMWILTQFWCFDEYSQSVQPNPPSTVLFNLLITIVSISSDSPTDRMVQTQLIAFKLDGGSRPFPMKRHS